VDGGSLISLTYHIQVATPASIANKTPAAFTETANANWTLGKTELQGFTDALQDALSSLFGEGLLTCPSVSYSEASLAVTLGTFKALVGKEVVYAGGPFTALANQTGAYCYLTQDGLFANTEPSTNAYAVIAEYDSDADGVTSFTLVNKILIPQLTTVTETFEDVLVPEDPGYYDGYWNHSEGEAGVTFVVPGFVKLEVDPASDFYIELLYNGLVDSSSDTPNSPPHNMTEAGIHFRVTRIEGYYYVGNPTCTVVLSRSGLAVAS